MRWMITVAAIVVVGVGAYMYARYEGLSVLAVSNESQEPISVAVNAAGQDLGTKSIAPGAREIFWTTVKHESNWGIRCGGAADQSAEIHKGSVDAGVLTFDQLSLDACQHVVSFDSSQS